MNAIPIRSTVADAAGTPDAAVRASSPGRAGGASSAPQWALPAALAGAAGIAGLSALAWLQPALGALQPALIVIAAGASGLPVALCLRRALLGGEREPSRSAAPVGASARLRAGPAAPPRFAAPEPAPAPRPRASGAVKKREAEGLSWALPRAVADSVAEVEARERRLVEAAAAPPPRLSTPAPNTRRHARIKPLDTRTVIALQDGRRIRATIMDVSQSGVAIEGDLPGLWIGSMVTVGSRRAKLVRTLPRGMAFEFSTPIPADALTAGIVL